MTTTTGTEPVYDIEATVRVDAPPDLVYAVASDITRMVEWSPENTGGEWVSGEPGELGARLKGHNKAGDVSFTTECEVIAADGKRFAWAVLSSSPEAENSVWSFEFEPDGAGCELTQRYVLRQLTETLREVFGGLSGPELEAALEGRKAGLQAAMYRTLEGIKATVEKPAA